MKTEQQANNEIYNILIRSLLHAKDYTIEPTAQGYNITPNHDNITYRLERQHDNTFTCYVQEHPIQLDKITTHIINDHILEMALLQTTDNRRYITKA